MLDIGDGVSHVVPIFEGYSLPHAVNRLDLAGSNLTDNLVTQLSTRGFSFSTSAEREIVRILKEECCYVAHDYEKELEKARSTGDVLIEKNLPDGSIVNMNEERFSVRNFSLIIFLNLLQVNL